MKDLPLEVREVLKGQRSWTILQGDGRPLVDRLGDGGQVVDVTLTDPPYDEKTHKGARYNRANGVVNAIDFASLDSVPDTVERLLRVTKRWVLAFCALEQLGEYKEAANRAGSVPSKPERWIRAGVWDKPDGSPQITGDRPAQGGEGIAIMHNEGRKVWNGGGHRAFWTFGKERTDRAHPTQKPLALMLKLVELFTEPGELILDPYCGSGTTGVACLKLGRRFIGCELSPEYHGVAVQRMEAVKEGLSLKDKRSGQTSLLGNGK